MRTFDLSPLLRATVGFDRMDRLFDSVGRLDDQAVSYPPYNIEKHGEDKYRITMAVAGFAEDELTLTVQQNTLLIAGKAKEETAEAGSVQFLHRGIARRAFERRFELADTIKVTGAGLDNGLLTVDLVRVIPEAMKPRQIKIDTVAPRQAPVLENKAA